MKKKATQENVSATIWSWGKATINVAIDAEKVNRDVKRWLQASKFKGLYKRLNPSGITGIHPDQTDFSILEAAIPKVTEYLNSAKVVTFFKQMVEYLTDSKDISAPIAFKKEARKSLLRKEGGGLTVSQSLTPSPHPEKKEEPKPVLSPQVSGISAPDIRDDPDLQKVDVAYCGALERDEVSRRLLACPDKTYLLRWSDKTGFVLSYNEKGKVLHVSGLKRLPEGLLVSTPGGEKMCKNFMEYIDIMKGKNIINSPITKYMDPENGYVFVKV